MLNKIRKILMNEFYPLHNEPVVDRVMSKITPIVESQIQELKSEAACLNNLTDQIKKIVFKYENDAVTVTKIKTLFKN